MRAIGQAELAQGQVAQGQTLLAALQTRRAALADENAAQPAAPQCTLRLDAGFSSGENLTTLSPAGLGPGVDVAA